MGVYIKGMEMPIKCAKCPIADISAEYYFCEKIDWFGKERPSDCPLTELPPHGRLIDADAFISMLEDATERQRYKELMIDDCLTVDDVINAIVESLQNEGLAEGDAPTIITADKAESEE